MGSTEELKTGPPFYADRTRLLVYRDAQGNEQGIGTPEEWEKRRAHILANMQLVMGPLPDRSHLVDLDMAVEDTVDLADYGSTDIFSCSCKVKVKNKLEEGARATRTASLRRTTD